MQRICCKFREMSHAVRNRKHLLAAATALIAPLPHPALCQITPSQTTQIREAISSRIEALTILGGDYGLSGGTFRTTGRFQDGASSDSELVVTKLGGGGEIGDPKPLGDSGVGWQPRLQGNIGYIKSTNTLHEPLLDNDINKFQTKGVEFGGGARFWFGKRFSVAPTFMALYGRTSNDYIAVSQFMVTNFAQAEQLGLVNYNVDTLTLRPALNLQYVFPWKRAIVTASSEAIYYYTETVSSSNSHAQVSGSSGSWVNKVDLDAPLGLHLFNYELRSGGYFSRTELFGGLQDGLQEQHIYEVHGRLVLGLLNQFWKFKWIGIGGSWNWGGTLSGWTAGADISFQF
jgi:hypothetical protein